MYEIVWTDGTITGGYLSEADAVRTAMENGDPKARLFYITSIAGREEIGKVEVLSEDLGLTYD